MNRYLKIEDQGEIRIIRLSNPDRLNAKTAEMQAELNLAFTQAASNPTVKAIVLAGDGNRAFCAGVDLTGVEWTRRRGREMSEADFALYQVIEKFRKPVVAAVRGFALGGGLDLVLLADFAVAAKDAVLSYPEVALGLVPAFGLVRLPSLIGLARARDLILTGRRIQADEALNMGLVNLVVDADDLMQESVDAARRLSDNAPLAWYRAKEMLARSAFDGPVREAIEAIADLFETWDVREAVDAMSQRRSPEFRGR